MVKILPLLPGFIMRKNNYFLETSSAVVLCMFEIVVCSYIKVKLDEKFFMNAVQNVKLKKQNN